jgi:hypothetical protein
MDLLHYWFQAAEIAVVEKKEVVTFGMEWRWEFVDCIVSCCLVAAAAVVVVVVVVCQSLLSAWLTLSGDLRFQACQGYGHHDPVTVQEDSLRGHARRHHCTE